MDTAAEGLFMKTVLVFLGLDDLKLEVKTDSSACIGVCMRSGCGKIRHLELRSLWLQQRVARNVAEHNFEVAFAAVKPGHMQRVQRRGKKK